MGGKSGGGEGGQEGMPCFPSATESLLTSLQKNGEHAREARGSRLIIRVWRVCDAVEGGVVTQVPVLGIFLCSMFGGTRQPLN